MKICQKCGRQYSDDNMFCEACGVRLTPQIHGQGMQNGVPEPGQKKAVQPLLFLIPIAAALILIILLFLFWDKLPFRAKEDGVQETAQQGEEGSTKEEGSKEEEKDSKEEEKGSRKEGEGSNQEGSQKEKSQLDTQKEEPEEAYADAQVNGVDNAYVLVAGTVAEENGMVVLKLEQAVSVCAYDAEDKIAQKQHVGVFELDGDDLEEYLGSKVEVKGKLRADIAGDFSLQPVKIDVKQQASGAGASFAGHRYQLVRDDVTWQEAFEGCVSRGGYLAQINSEEEFETITDLIEGEGMQDVHFYLGGRRDTESLEYDWVNADGSFVGELLNPEGLSWASAHWMENEPSFTSEGDMELYVNLVYYQEEWVLNDVPQDVTVYYPGKTGYICEFDE